MSGIGVLAKLGVFVRPRFLDQILCAKLCQAIISGDLSEAEIYDGKGATVAPGVRKTLETPLPADIRGDLQGRIDGLMPSLTAHFGMPITQSEGATFLLYEAGCFFRPHRDRGAPDTQRRVSAVVFLNEHYAGGQLILYGLMPGAPDAGFPVEPEPGLLVAFESTLLHEVTPVTEGRRMTAVDWFF